MAIESCNLLAVELLEVQECIIDISDEQDLTYVPKTRQASSASTSNIPQNVHRESWTIGKVESQRRALNKRGAILDRLLLAHAYQRKRLDVIGHRLENTSTAISRIPDDILILILIKARFECKVAPELLSSVCHRWLAIVHGALGAPLWSHIELDMTSKEETVTLEAKTIRYLERSRTYPISFTFDLDASLLEEFELLHTQRGGNGISI